MATDITPELRAALAAAGGGPLELIDRETNEHFVVVRSEHFAQLKELTEDHVLSDESRMHLLRAAGQRAGWDDPEMDIYNDLDPRRKP
ncbi:MAG: hypothetical protein AB7U73_06055 [Pirellulales bacterium]